MTSKQVNDLLSRISKRMYKKAEEVHSWEDPSGGHAQSRRIKDLAAFFASLIEHEEDPKQIEHKEPWSATEAFANNMSLIKFLQTNEIKRETQEAWLRAYPDAEWVAGEILKADIWILSNPKKAPKNMARFLANWFSMGWERHRRLMPSSSPIRPSPKFMTDEELKKI